MAAGAEVLRAPRARHVGGWALVAAFVVLATALALAFALTRPETAPVTREVPVVSAEENGYAAYRGDVGAVARPCVQFGSCGTAFMKPADLTPVDTTPGYSAESRDWGTLDKAFKACAMTGRKC